MVFPALLDEAHTIYDFFVQIYRSVINLVDVSNFSNSFQRPYHSLSKSIIQLYNIVFPECKVYTVFDFAVMTRCGSSVPDCETVSTIIKQSII